MIPLRLSASCQEQVSHCLEACNGPTTLTDKDPVTPSLREKRCHGVGSNCE